MIMKILLCVCSLNFLFLGQSVYASEMVEKHIFVHKPHHKEDKNVNKKSELTEKLKRELDFTGVIKSQGKSKVFIRDKKSKKTKTILQTGDMIREMVVKKIGKNYVLLSNKKETVRLDLYKSSKNRPFPLKVEQINIREAPDNSVGKTGVSSIQVAGKKDAVKGTKNKNPASKKESSVKINTPPKDPTAAASNKTSAATFLEMIKKSQQKQSKNPEFHNKFMDFINKAKNQ
ncbi:MAG: hypothetical protein JEZ12_11710 [Desulfobacterium sp.]|nr:hypothetical protein [Desulfobacterium sp.]